MRIAAEEGIVDNRCVGVQNSNLCQWKNRLHKDHIVQTQQS